MDSGLDDLVTPVVHDKPLLRGELRAGGEDGAEEVLEAAIVRLTRALRPVLDHRPRLLFEGLRAWRRKIGHR